MKRLDIFLLCCLLAVSGASQTLSLDSCLHIASRNNLLLRNARLDVEKAKDIRQQALSNYFPRVSGQAVGYYALHPLIEIGAQDLINGVNNENARQNLQTLYDDYGQSLGLDNLFSFFRRGFSVGATAIQPLCLGGQIVNGNRLARIGVEAAELEVEIKERDLLLSVEESYWLVIALQDKQQTLDAVLALLDTLSGNVEAAVSAGLATTNDRLQLRLRQNEIEAKQLQLNSGIRLAKQALCQSLGINYSDSLMLSDDISDPGTTYPVTDSTYQPKPRPEQRLLALQVKAANLKKDIEIGKAMPQLMVGGTYAYNHLLFDRGSGNGMLFATLQVPLTQWWESSFRIKEQRRAREQAENEQKHYTQLMELELMQAGQEAETAEKQAVLCQTAIDAAEENLHLATANYGAGLCPVSDLLQAQTLYMQAKNDLTDARIRLRIACRRWAALQRGLSAD